MNAITVCIKCMFSTIEGKDIKKSRFLNVDLSQKEVIFLVT